jgi:hypothetical protein
MALTYVDAYQRRGTKRYELDTLDFTAALARAATLATALGNLMEADILKYTVGQEVPYTDTVVAGANRDEGITLSADLGAGKTAAIKIPTPVNTVINPDGTVDITDGLITALETEYLSTEVLVSDGEVVLDFLSGKLDK